MADEKSTEVTAKTGFDFRIILVGLVLFLVAMGASYFVMKSLIAPLVPEANKPSEPVLSGNLIEVGEFTTNVNTAGASRFLKVTVTVEVSSEDKKAKETISNYMPVIKDSILGILAAQSVADLDVHNRDYIKTAIQQELNSKIGTDLIKNVYFTDFIMQ